MSVERLFDYQVNGCSLPLKIYTDIDSRALTHYQISGMYQSLILPSQVKYATSSSIYKEIELDDNKSAKCFVSECFGTDQQSIKLHFYDSTHSFDSNGFVVFFHSNGGYIGDDMTKTVYSQKIGLYDVKPLKRNMFTKYYAGVEPKIEEIFVGWSLSAVDDNNAEFKNFDDTQNVSKEIFEQAQRDSEGKVEMPFGTIVRGTEVHLYAVW